MAKAKIKKVNPNVETLVLLCKSLGYNPHREFIFHPERKWRFDLAIPELKIAFEYHGHAGFFGGGASGHSTIKGLTNDCEKINHANWLGWRVFAFTALHFRQKERIKHKLVSPTILLEGLLKAQKKA